MFTEFDFLSRLMTLNKKHFYNCTNTYTIKDAEYNVFQLVAFTPLILHQVATKLLQVAWVLNCKVEQRYTRCDSVHNLASGRERIH